VKNPDKTTDDMNTKIAYTLTKQRLAVEGKWPTYYLTVKIIFRQIRICKKFYNLEIQILIEYIFLSSILTYHTI